MTSEELLERYAAGERDFRGADLAGAYLTGADLTGANLTGADLAGAYLTEADLTHVHLRGANLHRITLCGATIDGVVLSPDALGGPGHILCALTDAEWEQVRTQRDFEKTKSTLGWMKASSQEWQSQAELASAVRQLTEIVERQGQELEFRRDAMDDLQLELQMRANQPEENAADVNGEG